MLDKVLKEHKALKVQSVYKVKQVNLLDKVFKAHKVKQVVRVLRAKLVNKELKEL